MIELGWAGPRDVEICCDIAIAEDDESEEEDCACRGGYAYAWARDVCG